MGKKVLAAMSGGVDSSVAVWLLQQQGFDCAGAIMLLGGAGEGGDSVEDARAVALALGIPFHVFDFSGEFDSCVLQKFAGGYLDGATPNPCIDCNRHLKFGAFLRRAVGMGFDYIATGHYARITRDTGTGLLSLQKAADRNRDQSYVLASALPQDRLSRVLFPLGELTKPQVRQIAEEQGFANARKHDSQDICFIPDGDYGAFLERYTGKACPPGDILDLDGRVIGRHKGAVRYTAGQRKGLGIAADQPVGRIPPAGAPGSPSQSPLPADGAACPGRAPAGRAGTDHLPPATAGRHCRTGGGPLRRGYGAGWRNHSGGSGGLAFLRDARPLYRPGERPPPSPPRKKGGGT